jgi:hypothetical protein
MESLIHPTDSLTSRTRLAMPGGGGVVVTVSRPVLSWWLDTMNHVDPYVSELAAALGETEPKPLHDLQRVLDHVGMERARTLLQQARDLDAAGQVLTENGTRQRTLGGIFFQLAREHLPRTPPPTRHRRLRWHEAVQAAAEAQAGSPAENPSPAENLFGEASTVKITLIGRPGRVIKRDNVVVTTMHNSKRPALPAQLPKLSGADVETKYTIFITAKQWRKVETALADKDDQLIIEGYPFVDPDVEGVCVFAKSTTTKLIQRAIRESQHEKRG